MHRKSIFNYSIMKKFSIVALLLILFAIDSKTQGLYSQKNLEKASKEDLSLYLTKAQKQKKTGGVITIIGSSTVIVGGVLIATNRETAFYVGFFTGLAGLGITAIGLPILETGSSRVKKVTKLWNTKYNATLVDLVPCSLYNYQTQHIQPGISLRIRF
jgi:hypothetical protein